MRKPIGKIKILIMIVLFLGVAGVQRLYEQDSKSLERVRPLLVDLKAFCATKKRYPKRSEFESMLKRLEISNPKEWLLFISEDQMRGSLQYPMNLPVLWAPGKAKISEFLPVIYAFVIPEPCQGLLK